MIAESKDIQDMCLLADAEIYITKLERENLKLEENIIELENA